MAYVLDEVEFYWNGKIVDWRKAGYKTVCALWSYIFIYLYTYISRRICTKVVSDDTWVVRMWSFLKIYIF